MSWQVVVDSAARKSLKKMPRNDAERIAVVLYNLATDPYMGDIEKMQGEENTWRRRVGAYRIFYEIHVARKFVSVFAIQRRTSNTY